MSLEKSATYLMHIQCNTFKQANFSGQLNSSKNKGMMLTMRQFCYSCSCRLPVSYKKYGYSSLASLINKVLATCKSAAC